MSHHLCIVVIQRPPLHIFCQPKYLVCYSTGIIIRLMHSHSTCCFRRSHVASSIVVCDWSIVIIVSCVLSIRLEIFRLILNDSYILNKDAGHRIPAIIIRRGLRVWRGASISLIILRIVRRLRRESRVFLGLLKSIVIHLRHNKRLSNLVCLVEKLS